MQKTFLFNHPGNSPQFQAPILATDGKLYGTISGGGAIYNCGLLYSVDTATGQYTVEHTFIPQTGIRPYGNLIQASDGNLYGTCSAGGTGITTVWGGFGTIFCFNPVTKSYTIYSCGYSTMTPMGELTEVGDYLYGASSAGGQWGGGAIFKIHKQTLACSVLYDFYTGVNGPAYKPYGGLTLANDSCLYGLTSMGGTANQGIIFKYNIATNGFNRVHDFYASNGYRPMGSLTLAPNGKLYGTACGSVGTTDSLVVFNYDVSSHTYNQIAAFVMDTDILHGGKLCMGQNGMLYGALPHGPNSGDQRGLLFSINTNNDTYTPLFHYDSNADSASFGPRGGVAYANNKLYGINSWGVPQWPVAGGSFFSFNLNDNHYERLWDFGQYDANPNFMAIGIDSNLYLTANGGYKYNHGWILRFHPATGALDTLFAFPDSLGPGEFNIVQAPNGVLYGIINHQSVYDDLFSIRHSYLYSYNPTTAVFKVLADLGTPLRMFYGDQMYRMPNMENVLLVLHDKLYGTAALYHDTAVLFCYDLNADEFRILYKFHSPGVCNPGSNLLYDGISKLYGTYAESEESWTTYNGVIFCFNLADSTFNILHHFTDNEGANPAGTLIWAPNNKIFGYTTRKGLYNFGGIFCFDPATNTDTVFQYFNNLPMYNICKRLILADDNQIYGTSEAKFPNTDCNIFRISPDSLTVTVLQHQRAVLFGSMPAFPCGPLSSQMEVTVCAGDSYSFNGTNYNTTGNYTDTLASINGCDSVVTLHLIVQPAILPTYIQATICANNNYYFNGIPYNVTGNYNDTLISAGGCDSIITLQLTVNAAPTSTMPITICAGQTYTYNDTDYTVTGSYVNHLPTLNGCDSIVILQLTVLPQLITNVTASICQGESYIFNGANYTVGGAFNDTLASVTGCDSIVRLLLTVWPAITNPGINVLLCEGDSYTFNGSTYNSTGTYTDTLTSIHGCDSVVSLQLYVNHLQTSITSASICPYESYSFNGKVYNTTGTYFDTLTSSAGCDSISALYLLVYTVPPAEHAVDTICAGDNFFYYGKNYTAGGYYDDTVFTSEGCMRPVTLQLTVNPLPVVVWGGGSDTVYTSTPPFTLGGATPPGGMYTGTSVNSNQFNPAAAGAGTFEVTYTYADENACRNFATKTIVVLLPNYISESNDFTMHVYPNPADDILIVESPAFELASPSIKVIDLTGAQIQLSVRQQGGTLQLQTHSLPSGVYQLKIACGGGSAYTRFIKK